MDVSSSNMAAGISVGVTSGVAIDQLAVGIGIGIGVGLALSVAFGEYRTDRQDKE